MFKSHLSPHIPAIQVYNPLNLNVWCLNPIEIPCIPIPLAKNRQWNHQWNPIKSHKITIKSPLNPIKSPLNPIKSPWNPHEVPVPCVHLPQPPRNPPVPWPHAARRQQGQPPNIGGTDPLKNPSENHTMWGHSWGVNQGLFLWIFTSQIGVFFMRTRDLKRQFIRISSSQMGSQPSPTGISVIG